jgi:hypothetical protein
MKPKKKIRPKIPPKPRARKKHPRATRVQTWVACGFDTSMSSLAGAAVGYDNTLGKLRGPVFTERRWQKGTHYFDRLKDAAKSHDLVHELIAQLGITPEQDEIFIAQEEPWPMGMTKRLQSGFLKQQAEISGAFLGGLIRYGYSQVFQIGNHQWRQIIARDLGITIHFSKWQDPKLAGVYNCKPGDTGKFRAKQWAMLNNRIQPQTEVPDWPDIIESSKDGKIPRPEGSKAKAVQPDDRYDALAIMQWMVEELERGLVKPEPQALRKSAKLSLG